MYRWVDESFPKSTNMFLLKKIVLNKVCGCTIKQANVVSGVLYFVVCAVNLAISVMLRKRSFNRIIQLNVGFQAVILLPTIPFFAGVFFGVRELIVPFLITLYYSVSLNLLVLIISLFINELLLIRVVDSSISFSKYDVTWKYVFFAFELFQIILNILLSWFVYSLWFKLSEEEDKFEEMDLEVLKSDYAYRRFGIYFAFIKKILHQFRFWKNFTRLTQNLRYEY